MNRLPRLHGAALKTSNETLLADYGNLAKFVVGKRARACQLSRDQAEDLLHSILVELFKAPVAYRNYKGVSLMLKHKMRDVLARTLKTEAEIPAGLMGPALMDDDATYGCPEQSVEPEGTDGIDFQLILRRLNVLSNSERVALSLLYGLDGCEAFSPAAVARKLGKDTWWVHRKREQTLRQLRSALRIEISKQNAEEVRSVRTLQHEDPSESDLAATAGSERSPVLSHRCLLTSVDRVH